MSQVALRRLLGLTVALLSLSIGAPLQAQCTANIPHIDGEWRTLPYLMPINPISATLLHTGQVLLVAGSENDADNNAPGADSYRIAFWDPTGTTQNSITVQNVDYDVFCSGTAALPDGRALVVGGTSDYSFTGDNRASIFDPATTGFVQSQSMVDGRWYATAITLGDGRVMAFSGLNETTGATNNTVEIYDLRNAGAGWTSPVAAPFSPPFYPPMWVLPNGKVFYNGQGGGRNANAWIFDPTSITWAKSVATTRDRYYGSAVLLPLLSPSYTPKVMNFGGGNPATNTTEIIDLSATSPSWTPGPPMSTGRIQMNAVLLPNGKVLAEGGSVNNESPDPPGKTADLYDPVSNTFGSGGTASYSRLYHSTALLLPDATVVSMGSNPGPRGNYEPAIEIYRPAYLFDANDRLITNRPSITSGPSGPIGYNAAFSVTYTSASAIKSAVLVRLGSTTHTFDMDQRLIGLCGPSPQLVCTGAGTLTLTSPPNGNIAPPGYYMLFLLDSAGVPSKAQFLQLSPYTTAPPRGAIASPTLDTTIPAGGAVYFSTSSTATKYSWVFPGGSPATSTAQTPGNVSFNTPGTYVASLTVIDSAGNSDPSPPTRTITVLPSTADFSITVSPSSQAVSPGQSITFTVTVSPQSGFMGTVSFSVDSESGFPSGVTSSGFTPPSITGSGSSTLTMNTTRSVTPRALSLTITGTAGPLTHTASTTLLVNITAPASLSATPGNAQVALSWPTSVVATSYHVKRAAVSGGPYVTVACTMMTNYTDTGLANGTTYYYVVSAAYSAGFNAGGESPDSGEASATPQPAAPSPPTGLKATPGDGRVVLSWNASAGATSYNVKRATASGGPYTTIASPSATSSTDTGLVNGTTYYYVMSAVNAGGESANSAEASATPVASPLTVTLTAPSTGATVGSAVTVAASASSSSGVAGVQFRLDGGNLGSEDTVSPYTLQWDTTTVANGSHTLTAVARDVAGRQTVSAAVTVTVNNAGDPLPVAVVAYNFDEGTSTTATDLSGNRRTGTVAGATWTAGKYGNALSFGGNGAKVTSGLSTQGTVRTYAIWTKRTGPGWGNLGRIFDKQRTGGAEVERFYNDEAAGVYKYLRVWSGGSGIWSIPQPSLNVWHHIAVVYDASVVTNTPQIYVDGIAQTVTRSSAPSGTLITTSDPYVIGNRAAGERNWGGALDDLRVYDAVLTAAQIQTAMRTPVATEGSPPPPLPAASVAYNFDEGTGTTVTDLSGNQRTGTVAGATWTAGKYSGALSFDGNGAKMTSGLSTQGIVRTYAIWTKRTGPGWGNLGRIFDKYVGGAEVERLYNDESAGVYRYLRGWSGGNGSWSIPQPSLNVWHHIAVVYDASAATNIPQIYVDGVAQTVTPSGAPSGTLITTSDPYVIGNRAAVDRGWSGLLDEFRVYDVALTAAQIQAVMSAPMTPTTP